MNLLWIDAIKKYPEWWLRMIISNQWIHIQTHLRPIVLFYGTDAMTVDFKITLRLITITAGEYNHTMDNLSAKQSYAAGHHCLETPLKLSFMNSRVISFFNIMRSN